VPRRALLLAVVVPLLPLLLAIRGLREPVQVRIEGFLGATEEQVKPWEMLDVMIGSEPPRKFALTNIIVLSVGPVMGADILQAVEPIHPNFIFNGDQKQLDEISSALPNQYLKITGYLAFGPQRILVQTIEKSEPITGPTPTPSMRELLLGF
jgi:hypothetical protein